MTVHVLHIETHQLTDPRPGAWCDRCLLPSAISVRFALVSSSSLRVLRRFDIIACQDCGMVTSRH